MKWLKRFALKRPFLFGIALIFSYVLFLYLTYPIHFLFPENEIGQLYGNGAVKLIISLIYIAILWRFGWLQSSGLTRFGHAKFWLLIAIVLAYHVMVNLRCMTGDFRVVFPHSPLTIANLAYYLPAGLMEEIMFRGLTLLAMIFAWGDTKKGLVKAILLSSLLFGLIHLLNAVDLSIQVVLIEVLIAALLGFFWSAVFLAARSLWPAIILHWLTNALLNLKLIGVVGFRETFAMHLGRLIFFIPLLALGIYLVWRTPDSIRTELAGSDKSNP